MMEENKKYKVLLVEDDPNIAKLFTFNLKRAGYDYKHGEDGQKGFEIASEYKPDLIISDIMMPNVDGFKFREMLMGNPELKSIPFVFLTAKGSEEDILKGYDMDIEEYIIKTSSPKIILAKIAAILKSRESIKTNAESEVKKAAGSFGTKVVPDEFPNLAGFDVRHWHVPFHDIPGGDFIDYFRIDEENLAVILGDVMGKKWGAWYFAVAYAGYVRSAVRFALQSGKSLSASKIMDIVNESVFNDERISEVFVTLSIVLVNSKTKTVSYSGAGDLPIFYHSGENVTLVQSPGLLLGFNIDGGYEDKTINMNKGDEIFLITDGILESRNKEKKPLENEGFISMIKQKTEEDSLERIKREFTDYTAENYEDDVSMIYISLK